MGCRTDMALEQYDMHAQANKAVKTKGIERASEEHCKLLMFLRIYFFQTALFWRRYMPDMALWHEHFLQQHGPVLDAWFKVQTTFVDTMRHVARAMHTSAIGLPIGTAPGVLLGNAVLQHKVTPNSTPAWGVSFPPFFCIICRG